MKDMGRSGLNLVIALAYPTPLLMSLLSFCRAVLVCIIPLGTAILGPEIVSSVGSFLAAFPCLIMSHRISIIIGEFVSANVPRLRLGRCLPLLYWFPLLWFIV